MIILGVDLETTGLNTDTCDIVEIGVCKYDTDTKRIFNSGSILVYNRDYKFDEQALSVNKLSSEFLYNKSVDPIAALNSLALQMNCADYICAHNVPFDKEVLDARFRHYELVMPDKNWIDTRSDLPPQAYGTSKKLIHLAADHGIVNAFPHSALFDCVTMLQILSRYDISEVMARAESPSIKVKMHVPFEDNDFAKQRRYYWDKSIKSWCKDIKEFELDEEKKLSKYSISVLTNRETVSEGSGIQAQTNP